MKFAMQSLLLIVLLAFFWRPSTAVDDKIRLQFFDSNSCNTYETITDIMMPKLIAGEAELPEIVSTTKRNYPMLCKAAENAGESMFFKISCTVRNSAVGIWSAFSRVFNRNERARQMARADQGEINADNILTPREKKACQEYKTILEEILTKSAKAARLQAQQSTDEVTDEATDVLIPKELTARPLAWSLTLRHPTLLCKFLKDEETNYFNSLRNYYCKVNQKYIALKKKLANAFGKDKKKSQRGGQFSWPLEFQDAFQDGGSQEDEYLLQQDQDSGSQEDQYGPQEDQYGSLQD